MKVIDTYQSQLGGIKEYISVSTDLTRRQLRNLQTSAAFASPALQQIMEAMVTETIDKNVEALADHLEALNLPPNQKLCALHPEMGLLMLQGFGFSTETITYVALVNDSLRLPLQDDMTLTIYQHPDRARKS